MTLVDLIEKAITRRKAHFVRTKSGKIVPVAEHEMQYEQGQIGLWEEPEPTSEETPGQQVVRRALARQGITAPPPQLSLWETAAAVPPAPQEHPPMPPTSIPEMIERKVAEQVAPSVERIPVTREALERMAAELPFRVRITSSSMGGLRLQPAGLEWKDDQTELVRASALRHGLAGEVAIDRAPLKQLRQGFLVRTMARASAALGVLPEETRPATPPSIAPTEKPAVESLLDRARRVIDGPSRAPEGIDPGDWLEWSGLVERQIDAAETDADVETALSRVKKAAREASWRSPDYSRTLLYMVDLIEHPAPPAVAPSEPAPRPVAPVTSEPEPARVRVAVTTTTRGTTALPKGPAIENRIPAPAAIERAEELEQYGARGMSKAARREANERAYRLAQQVEQAGRSATPEEREVLARYSGEGGSGDSINEFYTSPELALAVWGLLDRAGFRGGQVLEPSCGSGVFLETAPEGASITGVELDDRSSAVARVLHPGHEVHTSALEDFATTDGRRFDVVVGNPPFGTRGNLRRGDKIDVAKAEHYFVDTALDLARDGGLVALVVPHGIMTGQDARGFRDQLHRKAELVVAHRLPTSAFQHSHVDVTTDIVVFRKRPMEVAQALRAASDTTLAHLGLMEREHQDFVSGRYFAATPDNVHGAITDKGNFGSLKVMGDMTPETFTAIGRAPMTVPGREVSVDQILEAASGDPREQKRIRSSAGKVPYPEHELGDIKVVDGVSYILNAHHRWERVDTDTEAAPPDGTVDVPASIEDARALTARIDALARIVQSGDPWAGRRAQAETRRAIEAFVAEHGNPHGIREIKEGLEEHKLHGLLAAISREGVYSDLLTRHIAGQVPATVDAEDVGAVARYVAARQPTFTVADLLAVYRGPKDEAGLVDELLASEDWAVEPGPDGKIPQWQHRDDYLTGQLYERIDRLPRLIETAADPILRAKLERQSRWLQAELNPKAIEDIDVDFRAGWIPLPVLSAYLTWRAANSPWGTGADVTVTYENGAFDIHGSGSGTHSLTKYLNRIAMTDGDYDTIAEMADEYKDWLAQSSYRQQIEDTYNRTFNGFRQRRYSSEPLGLVGIGSAITPHGYQNAAVRQLLDEGGGILAHDVGLGKTFSGIMLAMALKQAGLARKPTVVAPKSVLAKWEREILKLFPDANILVIGYTRDAKGKARDDDARARDLKFHQMRQNDYDIVLMSQPVLESLDIDPEREVALVQDDFWTQRDAALSGKTSKQMSAAKQRYESKMAGREWRRKGSSAIEFTELGIDALLLDEAHAYKNLWAARSRRGDTPKFLGGSAESKRALDLHFKAELVRQAAGGRNVYGFTATPTKNSPLEIYSMLSHVAPDAFAALGIRNSEEFIDRYCQIEQEAVANTRGEIETAPVVVGFRNLDEIRPLLERYVPRRTAAEVDLKIPEPAVHHHEFDLDEDQRTIYGELREILEEVARGTKEAIGQNSPLSIMHRMEWATMDASLVDAARFGGHAERSPKYRLVTEEARRVYESARGKPDEGKQIIFSDKNQSHERIKRHLVASGIPAEEIAILNADTAPGAGDRLRIQDLYNDGKIRVVIGNTGVAGEGIDLQEGTSAIHHLDFPWEPSTLQQRNGRGIRQGNKLEGVDIHYYSGRGSFDGIRWQNITGKANWMEQLWSGGNTIENPQATPAMSPEDILVMAAKDPEDARAKLDERRESRQAEYEAKQRNRSRATFGQYQALKENAKRFQPGTETHMRIEQRIDGLRRRLSRDPHFDLKDYLDAAAPVLIHERSGNVFTEGKGFRLAGGYNPVSYYAKEPSDWVVKSVNPREGTVEVRPYGSPSRTAKWRLSDLDGGNFVAPVDLDLAAEGPKILEHLEEHKDAGYLPPAVIRTHGPEIQAKLAANHPRWSRQALIVPGKGVELLNGEEAKRAIDAHGARYVLPTSEDRAATVQAMLDLSKRSEPRHPDYDPGAESKHATLAAFAKTWWGGQAVREGTAPKLAGAR